MTNIAGMIKQAQQMQAKMAELQERLQHTETTGQSGGGLVKVTLNGKGDCRNIKIDKAAVDPNDVAMLEDMILAAFGDAKAQIEKNLSDEMAKITGGMNLPPGFKLPF